MKRNNIKQVLKTLSSISLILTGILYVAYKFFNIYYLENYEIREFVILVYLISTMYYFRMDLNDKNKEIALLQFKLKEKG